MKRFLIPFLAALLLSLAIAAVPRPAVICGDRHLSRTELDYYYQSEYQYFLDAYGDYLQLEEETLPNDWSDLVWEQTCAVAWDTLSMVQAADAAGFAMTEAQEGEFSSLWDSFLAAAEGDMNAYLRQSYGAGARESTFRQYLYDAHLAAAYADFLYAAISPTEAQLQQEMDEEGGVYLDEGLDPSLWKQRAAEALTAELYAAQLEEIRSRYPFSVNK